MEIGTAKPSKEELNKVPHHFINSLSVSEDYSAGQFEKDALKVINELFRKKNVIVACGGSTLYYKSLLSGTDIFPEISESTRKYVHKLYENSGILKLQDKLAELDSDYFKSIDKSNPRRLIRALEVCIESEKAYSSFLSHTERKRDFRVIKIAPQIPRKLLYERINHRCDKMLEEGLLEEVKQLIPFKNFKSLKTVGYQEFFDFLDNKIELTEAINLFKQHTRNYAKRQLTWFNKESNLYWLDYSLLNDITDEDLRKFIYELEIRQTPDF